VGARLTTALESTVVRAEPADSAHHATYAEPLLQLMPLGESFGCRCQWQKTGAPLTETIRLQPTVMPIVAPGSIRFFFLSLLPVVPRFNSRQPMSS
jgi:hypothetical protein